MLFEPAHDAARGEGWPWWQRGLAWTAGIYAVEAASGEAAATRHRRGALGLLARRAAARPEPTHWRGLVRPAYAPVWFAVGLGAERLDDAMDRLRVAGDE